MKVLLIGASGQLAQDLRRQFEADPKKDTLTAVTHEELEIRDAARVHAVVQQSRPDVIINTAAFHRVDDCEVQKELAFAVNESGVRNLAQAAEKAGSALVQLSTDYVFDGRQRTPYAEGAAPNPLSVYGKSRLAGEQAVQQNCPRYLIVRTCGLYGIAGSRSKAGNFVETMLRAVAQGKRLTVVNDQVCTPTSTRDLANKMLALIRSGAQGLFHMTNTGECSWYEFAREIFRLTGIAADLSPTTAQAYGAKAQRPAYSVLDNLRLRTAGFEEFRPWQQALAEHLRLRQADGSA